MANPPTKDFKEPFEQFVKDSGITLTQFKEWYNKAYYGVPVGLIKHRQADFRKIVDDLNLGPNRRFLAALFSARASAQIMRDEREEAFLSAVILGEFINGRGFRLCDRTGAQAAEDELESRKQSRSELQAIAIMKSAFGNMKEDLAKEGFIPESDAGVIQSDS